MKEKIQNQKDKFQQKKKQMKIRDTPEMPHAFYFNYN